MHIPPRFRSPLFLPALLALTLVRPGAADGQKADDLFERVRQGGGWVAIPIRAGSGSIRTDTVPTLRLTLSGCVQVWPGHSGEWTFEARDPVNGGRLDATAVPGEGVPFSYRTGMRSLLDLQVRWSEPRDTTLLVWVGIRGISRERDACEPTYGGREVARGAAANPGHDRDPLRDQNVNELSTPPGYPPAPSGGLSVVPASATGRHIARKASVDAR
ncbi:MAG: hypothetical protein RQ751_13035 [Longimicrobiales bacterium]|nr:hypothetical protein [Longimicrobiales bacterium]